MEKSDVKKETKPITARLYVARRHVPHYFSVWIHRTHKSFLKSYLNGKKGKSPAEAFFRPSTVEAIINFQDGKETRYANQEIGEIHWMTDALTFTAITHELYHAVQQWMHDVGHNVNENPDEERGAELMGNLMGQMMLLIWDNGGKMSSYTVTKNDKFFDV